VRTQLLVHLLGAQQAAHPQVQEKKSSLTKPPPPPCCLRMGWHTGSTAINDQRRPLLGPKAKGWESARYLASKSCGISLHNASSTIHL